MIPLILKLKIKEHKEIAQAQDLIVEALFNVFDKAVLHGGTSIWRCYNGNRFSEDIDVIIPKDLDKINIFFEKLAQRGFSILKKKITQNSLFSKLKINNIIVRFEALFKHVKGILKEYITVDSTFLTVYTLASEDIIKEKINAYLSRLKIRDLYDIFFLLRYSKKDIIKEDLKKLINNFKLPIDKKELKVLIIEGICPSIEEMLDYIKRNV